MSDVFHTETYAHKSGKNYHIEWSYCHDIGAPHEDYEGHGVVVELDFDPTDEDEVENHLEFKYDDDDDELLAEQAILQAGHDRVGVGIGEDPGQDRTEGAANAVHANDIQGVVVAELVIEQHAEETEHAAA